MKVFLIAGEVSGDRLGAGLISALKAADPSLHIAGVGGKAMANEGLASLFPITDIAVMGVLPVLAQLPNLLKRIHETAEAVLQFEPDVLVIIDSPDFTHRVARRVRAQRPDLPIVNYVSPTVWAWRPGRAVKMRAYIDHVLALLPFEAAAYERLGGPPCSYVGHPLIEQLEMLRPDAGEECLRAAAPPLVLILPGSRQSEITRLLDDFGIALQLIRAAYGPVEAILPTLPHLEKPIRERTNHWPFPPNIIVSEAEKYAAFRRARAALAASGTVTLELALAGVPQCVAYKVSWPESILKYLINVPSIVLPNLILGEKAVPEFLQDACTPRNLARSLYEILRDGPQRECQIAAFRRLAPMMTLKPGEKPSQLAAAIVLQEAWKRKPELKN